MVNVAANCYGGEPHNSQSNRLKAESCCHYGNSNEGGWFENPKYFSPEYTDLTKTASTCPRTGHGRRNPCKSPVL